MRRGPASLVAMALLGGCIRERPPRARDAGVSEALLPSPGREVPRAGAKPDAAVAAPTREPEAPSIEERLRRCDALVEGPVVRLSDDVAYATESTAAGPVIRLVRRAGGEFVCERYMATAGSPGVAWPDARSRGGVRLATVLERPVGTGSAVLVELDEAGAVRGAALIEAACGPGSTLSTVQVFAGAPSIQVRCWVRSESFFTATDLLLHRDPEGWRSIAQSESGRVPRAPSQVMPPANARLPGSIRVLESGATPRLEVASSSVDVSNGSVKFSRQVLRWSDAERRFELAAPALIEHRDGG